MRARLPIPLVAACLLVAGCGDEDEPARTTQPAATTTAEAAAPDARSRARNIAVAMEACFAESQDYAQCDDPKELRQPGLELGDPGEGAAQPKPGKSYITVAERDEYAIVVKAEDGTRFVLARAEGGQPLRLCDPAGRSGCGPDGDW